MNKRKLLNQVQALITEGQKFTPVNFCYPNDSDFTRWGGEDKPEWLAWKTRSFNLIIGTVDKKSPAAELAYAAASIRTQGSSLDKFVRLRDTMISGLKLVVENVKDDTYGELKTSSERKVVGMASNKIFVVHGHDHILKTEVEKLLSEIGLEPIVLHRKPDEGQTIIEKFEKHSDVGYAFILLTPDEIAYPAGEESKKEKRSRPNVIFEFGYFVGRLGRNRVCCLYKEGVVLPSDLSGLLYKKISASLEEQAYSIIKELQAAGYKVKL